MIILLSGPRVAFLPRKGKRDMEKVSVEKSIHSRKISHPNWIYDALGLVWKLFVYPKYHVHYTFKKDFRKIEGPFFFISNHASRLDYIFVGAPLLPLKMNFVAGYNEFHRSHLSKVFELLRVIPKKNFTPDLYTVREISRVIKSGHGVCIFPEGIPCAPMAAIFPGIPMPLPWDTYRSHP